MTCVEVSDRKGGAGGKCPLGILIMAPLLPLAVTVPRGGQDKRKAMFHLCCLGISNSKGSKRRETAGCYIGGRRGNKVTLSFSPYFSLLASSAAVFKIRHLNKSVLMASRQEKRRNLITVTVLFNELKASGSKLLWESSVVLAIVFVIYTFLNVHLGFSSRPTRGMPLHHDREEGVRDTLAGRQTQRQPAVNY